MPPRPSTMLTSDSDGAVMTTPTIARPWATWRRRAAAARMEPRNEYFDPDAEPPSMRP